VGANGRTGLRLLAGWSVWASGVVAILGILPFATFPFGISLPRLNDSAVLVQYLLALPVILVVFPILRARSPIGGPIIALVGTAGILGTALVQLTWMFEPFGPLDWLEYIVLIGTSMAMIGVFLIVTSLYVTSTAQPALPNVYRGILAATYFGYPIWAFWLGRQIIAKRLIGSRANIQDRLVSSEPRADPEPTE
jgi:hypothetical protein